MPPRDADPPGQSPQAFFPDVDLRHSAQSSLRAIQSANENAFKLGPNDELLSPAFFNCANSPASP